MSYTEAKIGFVHVHCCPLKVRVNFSNKMYKAIIVFLTKKVVRI